MFIIRVYYCSLLLLLLFIITIVYDHYCLLLLMFILGYYCCLLLSLLCITVVYCYCLLFLLFIMIIVYYHCALLLFLWMNHVLNVDNRCNPKQCNQRRDMFWRGKTESKWLWILRSHDRHGQDGSMCWSKTEITLLCFLLIHLRPSTG